jgi:GDP-4-dehydro-6-deoxy-D-mannose reductase
VGSGLVYGESAKSGLPLDENAFLVRIVSAFARQIARIGAGLGRPLIRVGNFDSERDFLDVRDVADAYAKAVKRAQDLELGIIILNRLVAQSRVKITIEQDPAHLRSSDLILSPTPAVT